MKLRAVMVDDEILARNRLRKFLEQEPDVEIVGECADGPAAVECIRSRQPNLVFLDVQMPQFNGFEVVRALPAERLPAVVFVTAHDQHAVEAFTVQALDYLLKPFTQARLREAVQRARRRLESPPSARSGEFAALARLAENNFAHLNRFAVKDGNQTLFVKAQDVDYIEAAANYVVLHTTTGNHVLRETLRNLEEVLSPALFVRISRSVIVRLDRIKAIRAEAAGEWRVVLLDGGELEMTRGLKDVQKRLQYSGDLPVATRPLPD